MSRPNYKHFLPFILQWEGGYVNDPVDRGGETNMGITRGTFNLLSRQVLGLEPTDSNFRNMTKEQAGLFVKHFWDVATFNNSIDDQSIAEAMTSWHWGSGRLGLMELQRLVNTEFGYSLTVDGVVGPKTVQAVNSISPGTLLQRMIAWREQFFRRLAERDPSQNRFLNGWLNRLASFADRHKKKLLSAQASELDSSHSQQRFGTRDSNEQKND